MCGHLASIANVFVGYSKQNTLDVNFIFKETQLPFCELFHLEELMHKISKMTTKSDGTTQNAQCLNLLYITYSEEHMAIITLQKHHFSQDLTPSAAKRFFMQVFVNNEF